MSKDSKDIESDWSCAPSVSLLPRSNEAVSSSSGNGVIAHFRNKSIAKQARKKEEHAENTASMVQSFLSMKSARQSEKELIATDPMNHLSGYSTQLEQSEASDAAQLSLDRAHQRVTDHTQQAKEQLRCAINGGETHATLIATLAGSLVKLEPDGDRKVFDSREVRAKEEARQLIQTAEDFKGKKRRH